MAEDREYLPISMLNQLAYCERRFWLMHVHGEMAINAPVLEGIHQHERAHTPSSSQAGEQVVHRRLYVWSDRLHIAGFADLVEEADGHLTPLEYKRGRMGRWQNDHIQLCAQALCLEEQSGRPVERGQIFYWGSRRRVDVEFDDDLRMRTEAAIARAFELLAAGRLPPPLTRYAKCRDCSLEPICLPREVIRLQRGTTR